MTRISSDTARRAGLVAVAVALAAALAGAAARLAARPSGVTLPPLRRNGSRHAESDASSEQTYTCGCGTTYRVSGVDRHRVYWPAGAAEDAPVLDDRCVQCDAPLPGARETRPT